MTTPPPARHELHLHGAGGGCGRQCRHHHQPGDHHRHGAAGGDARRSRRLPTTPARQSGDFITSDTTLTVSGSNGALAAARRCRSAATAAPPGADVTQITGTHLELRRYRQPARPRASPTRRGWSIRPAMSAPPTSQAVTIDTARRRRTVDHGDCRRHRHRRRLHHQRHHADRCPAATARLAAARRCRSAATAAPPGTDVTQTRHDLELRRHRPTRTPRASPTRRGWSDTAGNIGTTDQPGGHHRHGGCRPRTGDHHGDCRRHRHVVERLHHQRHHADRCPAATARLAPARRSRSAATAAPPGTMSRRHRHHLEL